MAHSWWSGRVSTRGTSRTPFGCWSWAWRQSVNGLRPPLDSASCHWSRNYPMCKHLQNPSWTNEINDYLIRFLNVLCVFIGFFIHCVVSRRANYILGDTFILSVTFGHFLFCFVLFALNLSSSPYFSFLFLTALFLNSIIHFCSQFEFVVLCMNSDAATSYFWRQS